MVAIGSLVVNLLAETASFNANLAKAAGQLNSHAARMNRSLESVNRGVERVKRGLETLGIGLSIGALVSATKSALEYAGGLAETANQAGVTAKQLQIYRFAAAQTGVSQEVLEKGLARLNLAMGQAREGAKAPQAAFAKLSKILGQDVLRGAKTAGDELPLLANAMAKLSDQTRRFALERAVMGRGGTALDNLLREGAKALDEYGAAAARLGIVLSDRQIQDAHTTAVKFAALKTQLSANFAGVVANNATAILSLANALGAFVGKVGGAISGAQGLYNAISQLGLLKGIGLSQKLGEEGTAHLATPAGRLGLARLRLERASAAADELPNHDRATQLHEAAANYRAEAAAFTASVKAHASAARIAAASTGGDPAGSGFLSPEGHSKLQPREFINQSAQLDERLLRVKEQMATDTDAIADFVRQQINVESDKIDADIMESVSQGHITGLQGKILLSKSAELRAAELLQAEVDRQSQVAKDTLNLQITGLDDQKDLLQAQATLATTAVERRAIELRLLALDKQEETLKLDNILADKKASDADKAQAQKRKDDLDKIFAARAQSIIIQNAGPLEDYLRSVPTSIAQINEAMQRLRVDQFEKLNSETKQFADDLSSAVGQFGQDILDLKNPLTALKSLFTSLAHTFQQEFLIKPLTDAFRKKIGAPLAEKLVTSKIGGQTVHGVAGDFGLNAQQMNLALKTSTDDLLAFARALTTATGSIGGGLNLNGFGGFPSGSIATDSGFQSMVAGLSNNGASIGIDPSELAAVNDNLDVMSGVTAQATSALQAQIPALGQFGNGLLNVLSSLAGGGASGGAGGILGALGIFGKIGGLLGLGGGAGGGLSAVTALGGDAILFAAGGGSIDGPTLVGEHGPEMFTPKGPGSIIPAPQTAAFRRDLAAVSGGGGHGGHVFNINVTAPNTGDPRRDRQTSMQQAADIQHSIAMAARRGIAA